MTKWNIERTKLVDENKRPLALYHVTPVPGGIKKYYPLSHFGTARAAKMRAANFIFQALKLPNPAPLPEVVEPELVAKLGNKLPPLSTQKVYLYMRHPCKMPDLTAHTLPHYMWWFLHKYELKRSHLSGRELSEMDAIRTENMHYKKLLTKFIFVDPFVRSQEDLERELASERLFHPQEWKKNNKKPEYPSFLRPVLDKAKQIPFALAEHVVWQRMIRFLEGEGYDGFKYRNEYEDMGEFSYIIYRPEQAFNALMPEKIHEVPQLSEREKDFLLGQEQRFFSEFDLASPTERIISLKEGRLNPFPLLVKSNKQK